MQSVPDVLIVGGGVIGLTTAYFLGREGVRVTVLDQSAPGMEASWAGAGIIPPGNPARAATAYDKLRAASSQAFPALSDELRERTGIDNGYRVCGGIEVFESGADEAIGLWTLEGIEFERVEDTKNLEPGVRLLYPTAFLLPGMAQVRNPWHMRALIAACGQVGVRIEPNLTVTDFRTDDSRLIAVRSANGNEYPAGRFMIASGAWSDRLLSAINCRTGVHPVRGQIVLFRTQKPILRRIIDVGKRYIVPREDGRVLVGSTEEPEAGFEKKTTEAAIAGLCEFAKTLVPALSDAEIEKTWAGLRPGSPDSLPIMGEISGWQNAFVATGHFRAGIQLSPATGRVMTDLLVGRKPSLPIDDFRPDRPPARRGPMAFNS
jgi:glycine oxidase